MSTNIALHKAKKDPRDEFYTQLSDIENELRHYISHFKNKTVFCNCDDPYESNFFKYFAMNFNFLGLKKLIATSYATSPVVYTQLYLFDKEVTIDQQGAIKKPYKIEITEVKDENMDGAVDLSDVEYLIKNKNNVLTLLEGDGDFRSKECIELLKEADIIVTNPPFSLFREYVALLIEHNRHFLIIGSKNAITYKSIFPLISHNRLWVGVTPMGKDLLFELPKERKEELLRESKPGSSYRIIDGEIFGRSPSNWYTNLDHGKRHEYLTLYKKYTPEEYPKYDNYDAINVDRVADIPYDYDGVMGVPITFLDKYNPEQFEIVGFRKGVDGKDLVYSFEDHSQSVNVEREREREREKSELFNHISEFSSSENRLFPRLCYSACSKREKIITENYNPISTSIAGMVKKAENKINGKSSYT
ncbi:MAG: modification methylase [Ruminococcaceae bacterium]|nr:modification methylase [Oscillospiraceae bacterium]